MSVKRSEERTTPAEPKTPTQKDRKGILRRAVSIFTTTTKGIWWFFGGRLLIETFVNLIVRPARQSWSQLKFSAGPAVAVYTLGKEVTREELVSAGKKFRFASIWFGTLATIYIASLFFTPTGENMGFMAVLASITVTAAMLISSAGFYICYLNTKKQNPGMNPYQKKHEAGLKAKQAREAELKTQEPL